MKVASQGSIIFYTVSQVFRRFANRTKATHKFGKITSTYVDFPACYVGFDRWNSTVRKLKFKVIPFRGKPLNIVEVIW